MIFAEITIKRDDGTVITKEICRLSPGAELRYSHALNPLVDLDGLHVYGWNFKVNAKYRELP